MIVIAIIGILAAIALPAYAKYMARARFTEVTTALDGVEYSCAGKPQFRKIGNR